MISEADAVVIGAGAIGTSISFHLVRFGMKRVALVDRFDAGTQTSPRAAGLFKHIQSNLALTQLAMLSVKKMLNFETETGLPSPAVRSGSLMVARTPDHAQWIEREAEQSRAWGVEVEMIDGTNVQRLMPLLRSDGLRAACYTPNDIYIEEPTTLLNGYREAATRFGVTLLSNTPVTGIEYARGRVTGVVTNQGRIGTPIIIDAAGMWARKVGDTAGVKVLVAPLRHQLYITQPIVGVEPNYPIIRFADAAVYLRAARRGLMLGGFESTPLGIDPRGEPENFSVSDVPLDIRVLEKQTNSIVSNLPALQDSQIADHRGGCFTMTMDGRLFAGPAPELNGFWMATGCNGSGFSLAPGLGQAIAEWIVGGTPSVDMSGFAPARFANIPLTDDELTAAGVWQYAHYYHPTQK